jgi:DNA-binding winged helix-turn-helix (wHTH) protein/tetratricopeptide (TPR) repeat protein
MLADPRQIYEFGPFRVDGAERTLLCEGSQIALTDKVFDLLWLLVQNRGHALTKAELMQGLWPDTVVEENNLTVNISTLRKALGENAGQRRYIETLSRRGYRFVADVREPRSESLPPSFQQRPTFVGRGAELSRLADLLGRARAGQGRVVFIDADPGMGKTELAEQFLALAHSQGRVIMAQGRCLEQFGTGEAYLPFLEACRALLVGPDRERIAPLVRQHAPTWFAQFGTLSGATDTLERLRKERRDANSPRMLREMGDALEALSELEPVMLLLEDMHWADPSSSDLLRLLGQRAAARRILILATLRGNEVELQNHPLKNVRRELCAHDQCDEVALPLLDRSAIESYIDARFHPHQLPIDLADLILQATEGHPLFATRLLQMLVERADIRQLEGRWHLARPTAELELTVPNGVRGLIQKKLDSLGEDDLRALQHASVIGVEFSTSALASLLEADEISVDERLDPLARAHHLLDPLDDERLPNGVLTARYRFAHVLYQNVLYEMLVAKRRTLLHQKVAEHLSEVQGADDWRVAAQLALHFEAARDPRRAIHYLKLAADNASRLHANREAERYYAHALDLLDQLAPSARVPENVILHYNHGWCASNVGDRERGLLDFETMLAATRSPDFSGASPAAAQARDVVFDYLDEPWRDAFGLFNMPRMPNQDRSMGTAAIQCEAYFAIAYILLQTGRFEEMGVRTREFLALAEASHNEPRRVEALGWLATLELERGDLARARQYLNDGMPAARAIGHERALYMLLGMAGRLHQLGAEYEPAEAMNLEALPLSMEATGRVDCLIGVALARAHLGRVSAALAPLAEALDIARRTELIDSIRKITATLGWLHGEVGDWESAVRHLASAVEQARPSSASMEMRFRLELARAHAARGDVASAVDELEHAERLDLRAQRSSPSNDPTRVTRRQLHLYSARAEYLLERADHAAAEPAARALLRGATELGSPKHVALAHLLLGRAALARGDSDGARAAATAGIAVIERHPLPLIAWRLYAILGSSLGRTADHRAAAAAVARALELVEEIERGLDDAAMRATWSSSRGVRELRAAATPSPRGQAQA